MKFIRKRWRGIMIVACLISAAVGLGLVIWAGSEIASPSRRGLMDYHREFLSDPSAHGFMIDRFTAGDGTPCLVCTPDPSGELGERGLLIRRQLADRGLTLNPPGDIIGTLVLIHGRKGRKEDYLPIAERLCAVGFRCVIPDLPAHGDHPGLIATYGVREAGLPAQVLSDAAAEFAFDPQPAGLLGLSMGGSVAVHATALTDAPWKSLAVICSFDSFPKVIEGQAARYGGSALGPLWVKGTDAVYHWKTGIHFAEIQPHRHAASIRIPTLIAHGTEDDVSSIDLVKSLFESLPAATPNTWIEIPDAGHDDVLITSYPIYADIAQWMLVHVR